jgi:hypothetical protein
MNKKNIEQVLGALKKIYSMNAPYMNEEKKIEQVSSAFIKKYSMNATYTNE